MDVESKREVNNILIRQYKNSKYDISSLEQIVNFNFDFIAFVIKTYFPEYIGDNYIYGIGVMGIIVAINTYEMDQIGSFEEFMMACIKNEIEKVLDENKKIIKAK